MTNESFSHVQRIDMLRSLKLGMLPYYCQIPCKILTVLVALYNYMLKACLKLPHQQPIVPWALSPQANISISLNSPRGFV